MTVLKGVFCFEDQRSINNKNGMSIKVYLKRPTSDSEQDIMFHKAMVDFMGSRVRAQIVIDTDANFNITVEGDLWLNPKRLKNQDLLMVTIIINYDKPTRKKMVDFEGHQVAVSFEKIQKELPGVDEKDVETETFDE